MGRGKFKGKPTGHRRFSTPEEILAGTSSRPRTFKREEAQQEKKESEDESGHKSGEGSDDEPEGKHKGTQGIIEIENPNLVKPKNTKLIDVDAGKTTELSRHEREEIEKQKARERYMRLQEQGKTEQARKDLDAATPSCQTSSSPSQLRRSSTIRSITSPVVPGGNQFQDRLALIRQQREQAAKKREEEKAAREVKKIEGRR